MEGLHAFIWACLSGHKEVVQLLLQQTDRDIAYNAGDNEGWTGFMFACHHGHNDVVNILINYLSVIDMNVPKKAVINII